MYDAASGDSDGKTLRIVELNTERPPFLSLPHEHSLLAEPAVCHGRPQGKIGIPVHRKRAANDDHGKNKQRDR